MATASSTPKRHRKRLRSRIIISFALFGTALTALFAAAAIFLRGYLEDTLIGDTLERELANYADTYYRDPSSPGVPFSKIRGWSIPEQNFGNVPFAWKNLPNGVHHLTEATAQGTQSYKLAVRRDASMWFFLRYDVTQEERGRQLLTWTLIAVVLIFSALAFALGFWSADRVMAPVAELARRLESTSRRGLHEPLADHFADDEVGQLASALDVYAERLTALVERDREFNSDVSHELRTPLAVIQTTLELLLSQPDLNDRTRERLRRIDRSARQSSELINALLLLSRSERQGPQDGESTAVRAVVEQVIEAQRPQLQGKPVSLEARFESDIQVDAPPAVLAVVLNNLIGNAVKYTREGQVLVIVSEDRLVVEDSGPGIAPGDGEKLFERHVRGDSAKGTSGAGLGLAIVKRLCDLYGWHAELKPRAEGGARATLVF